MLLGWWALAGSFFKNRAVVRNVPGYALQTPPLQEWRTSFSDSEVVTARRVRKAPRQVTAYNVGDRRQTSNSPCISANGENICVAVNKGEKRCAANFVKLGTLLHIQDYGLCRVTDRMHRRYTNRVDIALPPGEKKTARQFGVQQLLVTELSSPGDSHKNSPPESHVTGARGPKSLHKKVKTQSGMKNLKKAEASKHSWRE